MRAIELSELSDQFTREDFREYNRVTRLLPLFTTSLKDSALCFHSFLDQPQLHILLFSSSPRFSSIHRISRRSYRLPECVKGANCDVQPPVVVFLACAVAVRG